MIDAFDNGYTLATHLYSGMSGVTRKNAFRYAGTIESAFVIDEMDVEIIADGVHLPAPLLKLIYKIKGAERTALITDSMRAAGMPPGKSILGNLKTGLPVIVAVRMMTSTPARIAGVSDRKGVLAKGKDADIVIFDEKINIETTIIQGRVVHTAAQTADRRAQAG